MFREEELRALLEGRRILVAGYGREGRSAERLIGRVVPGAECRIALQVEGGRWKDEGGVWHEEWPFDMVVKSPGIPSRELPDWGGELTGLTDLFLRVYGDLTIGVTGTKGKSTTASLIHHLLEGSLLAGNIGVPLFDIVDELSEGSVVVAELSCHQLENIKRGPHVGVLLNLYEEHLDHYEDYMGYKMAKMQLGLKQRAGDVFFYCRENAELDSMVESLKPKVGGCLCPYSTSEVSEEERRLLDACPLEGEHNRSNALVACRVAALVTHRPIVSFSDRLSTFEGLRHRMEKVGSYGGVTWYDDSISTIPAAAIAAVKALGRVDTLILGGFDRGIDYRPLVDFLNEHPVRNLVFVGEAGRRIYSSIQTETHSSILVEDDYTKIVPWCAEHTSQGGVVLLSPAAASYDAFKNFEVRGDFYREQIMKL